MMGVSKVMTDKEGVKILDILGIDTNKLYEAIIHITPNAPVKISCKYICESLDENNKRKLDTVLKDYTVIEK